jgi:hypothetical protein
MESRIAFEGQRSTERRNALQSLKSSFHNPIRPPSFRGYKLHADVIKRGGGVGILRGSSAKAAHGLVLGSEISDC